jgi:hypothetical protein
VHIIDSGLAGWLLGLSAAKINSRNPAALTEFGHLVETFAVGEILKQVSWEDEVITASLPNGGRPGSGRAGLTLASRCAALMSW